MRNKLKIAFNVLDYCSIGFLLLFFLLGIYLICARSPIVWVDLFFDDAYYYMGIARNLAEGNGSMFLPPFKTNGYQPLWLLLLSGSASIFGTSDRSLAIQIYTFCFVCVFLFAYASKIRYGYYFPAIFCSLLYRIVMLFGMETALLPVFFIFFMESSSWKKRGVAASAIFLTRLDALSVVIARDVYAYLMKEKSDVKHYRILIPVILLYFAVNYLLFGTPIPVSGLAKSTGNIPGENVYLLVGYFASLNKVVKLLFIILLLMLIGRGGISFSFRKELSVLAMAYYTINSGWPLWPWYYWPTFLILFYLCLESLEYLKALALGNATIGLMSFSSMVLILIFNYIFRPIIVDVSERVSLLNIPEKSLGDSFGRKNVELVDYVKRTRVKQGTFFAMGDRAGSFGFFLGNKFDFIHTEGIVGPYAYYKAMSHGQGKEYVDSLPIKYYIGDRERFIEDGGIIGAIEPIHGLSSHIGPYLICFEKASIVLDQSYEGNKRYVFDYQSQVHCPASIEEQYQKLKSQYLGISQFTLPSEWREGWWTRVKLF